MCLLCILCFLMDQLPVYWIRRMKNVFWPTFLSLPWPIIWLIKAPLTRGGFLILYGFVRSRHRLVPCHPDTLISWEPLVLFTNGFVCYTPALNSRFDQLFGEIEMYLLKSIIPHLSFVTLISWEPLVWFTNGFEWYTPPLKSRFDQLFDKIK